MRCLKISSWTAVLMMFCSGRHRNGINNDYFYVTCLLGPLAYSQGSTREAMNLNVRKRNGAHECTRRLHEQAAGPNRCFVSSSLCPVVKQLTHCIEANSNTSGAFCKGQVTPSRCIGGMVLDEYVFERVLK
jgi:hypothetical protein